MFSFLDNWWVIFYPSNWVDNLGIVLALPAINILCIFRLRWASKQINNFRTSLKWKLLLAIGIWITFLWTLPALIIGVISIVLAVLVFIFALAILGLFGWIAIKMFSGGEEAEINNDEYIIKKEDGKEVAYKKGVFRDEKIGELHNSLFGGSKETKKILGPNISVDKGSAFSTERSGKIGNKNGKFKKGLFDKNLTFHPDEKSEEE